MPDRRPGPIGLDGIEDNSQLVSRSPTAGEMVCARAPGPLGMASQPTGCLPERTPGPLGVSDWAEQMANQPDLGRWTWDARSELTRQLIRNIDAIEALHGAGIAVEADGHCEVLRSSHHRSGLETYVVVSEASGADATPEEAAKRTSRVGVELLNLGMNCGAAALSISVAVGSTAATPVTFGASGVVAYLSWAATVATGLQCAISVGRTLGAIFDPEDLDAIDSNEYYQYATDALDAISLLGVAVSVGAATKAAIALRSASSRSLREILKGMTRAERKQLARELADWTKRGKLSNSQFKALVRAGEIPKIFAKEEVAKALSLELRDAVAAAISFGSSAASGLVRRAFTAAVVQAEKNQ